MKLMLSVLALMSVAAAGPAPAAQVTAPAGVVMTTGENRVSYFVSVPAGMSAIVFPRRDGDEVEVTGEGDFGMVDINDKTQHGFFVMRLKTAPAPMPGAYACAVIHGKERREVCAVVGSAAQPRQVMLGF